MLAYSFSVYSQDEPENGFYVGAFEGLEYANPTLEAKYDLNTIDLNTLLTFSFLNLNLSLLVEWLLIFHALIYLMVI